MLCPEGHKQITRYYYHHTISSSIKFNLNPPAISCAKHLAPQSPQIAFSLGGWVGIITIALSCAQRGLRRTSEESCLPWSQVGSSESTRPLLGLKRKCHFFCTLLQRNYIFFTNLPGKILFSQENDFQHILLFQNIKDWAHRESLDRNEPAGRIPAETPSIRPRIKDIPATETALNTTQCPTKHT